jgi:hypothetical protein
MQHFHLVHTEKQFLKPLDAIDLILQAYPFLAPYNSNDVLSTFLSLNDKGAYPAS